MGLPAKQASLIVGIALAFMVLVTRAAVVQHAAIWMGIVGLLAGSILGILFVKNHVSIPVLGAALGALTSLQFGMCSTCDGSVFIFPAMGAMFGGGGFWLISWIVAALKVVVFPDYSAKPTGL
jgi:hypothetical protein